MMPGTKQKLQLCVVERSLVVVGGVESRKSFGSGCVDRVELIRCVKSIEFCVDLFIGFVVFDNDVVEAWDL